MRVDLVRSSIRQPPPTMRKLVGLKQSGLSRQGPPAAGEALSRNTFHHWRSVRPIGKYLYRPSTHCPERAHHAIRFGNGSLCDDFVPKKNHLRSDFRDRLV